MAFVLRLACVNCWCFLFNCEIIFVLSRKTIAYSYLLVFIFIYDLNDCNIKLLLMLLFISTVINFDYKIKCWLLVFTSLTMGDSTLSIIHILFSSMILPSLCFGAALYLHFIREKYIYHTNFSGLNSFINKIR